MLDQTFGNKVRPWAGTGRSFTLDLIVVGRQLRDQYDRLQATCRRFRALGFFGYGGCMANERRMMRDRSRAMGALGALLVGAVLPVDTVSAQTVSDLVGTYTLVSSVTAQGGTKTEPYGPNAKGIRTVHANDRSVIVTTRANLPRLASNSRVTGTPEESGQSSRGALPTSARCLSTRRKRSWS